MMRERRKSQRRPSRLKGQDHSESSDGRASGSPSAQCYERSMRGIDVAEVERGTARLDQSPVSLVSQVKPRLREEGSSARQEGFGPRDSREMQG